jgi:selenocysteine lyase/cysteine desulfurase
MIDWTEVRKQFPVTTRLAYLNSAAAGPVSMAAHAAATDYYQKMMSDGDVHWNRWLADRETTRVRLAKFINAEPDEIAFTTNTSSGMNLIVDALEERGEVISSELEFPVTTLPWMHRRIPVHLLPAVEGAVRVESIREAMTLRHRCHCAESRAIFEWIPHRSRRIGPPQRRSCAGRQREPIRRCL